MEAKNLFLNCKIVFGDKRESFSSALIAAQYLLSIVQIASCFQVESNLFPKWNKNSVRRTGRFSLSGDLLVHRTKSNTKHLLSLKCGNELFN